MPNPIIDWSPQDRLAYAHETERMANDLYDYLVPWRWPQWYRTAREVRRRLAWSREARLKWEREHGRA